MSLRPPYYQGDALPSEPRHLSIMFAKPIKIFLQKKTLFDELTQEKVQLMINHINSTSRPKFNGETPINKALKSFDKNAMEKLGLEIILPDEIHLKPDLLK